MLNVGIITCVELPEPDPDQEPLLDALRQADIHAELIAWDDPNADASQFDLCVFRSCWNYHWHYQEFHDWVARSDAVTVLANSAATARWNLHKSYLRELEAAGIPTIPTAWFEQGDAAELLATMNEHQWQEVVIKPTISAGSFRTERFHIDRVEQGQEFLAALVADADTMVQRYMLSVEEPGERTIVWIDSLATHAVVKSPRLSDGIEKVSDGVPVTTFESNFVDEVLSQCDDNLLYARIDVVEDDAGGLLLSELELIEPSLFLVQCSAALERLVAAIARRGAAGK